MKELSIEEKAQRYEEAINVARSKIKNDKDHVLYEEDIADIFPELKESEDEKVEKAIYGMVYDSDDELWSSYDVSKSDVLAWLDKQGEPIDKEKVLIGARKDVALSIMNFLDRCTLGMCLSNMECKDLEDAVVDSDWSKVYDYMKKKLETTSEQKSTDKVKPKFSSH